MDLDLCSPEAASGPKMERLPAVAHTFMKLQTFWPGFYHFSPPVLLFWSPHILTKGLRVITREKTKLVKGFLDKDFHIKQLDLDTLFFKMTDMLIC